MMKEIKRNLSVTFLVKISYEKIECNNIFCNGGKYLKTDEIFPKVDKIFVSLTQIGNSYCEISIRCFYCRNLMVGFGLVGFDYETEKKLPDLDWQNVILRIRNEWMKDVRQPSRKIILDYHLERVTTPIKKHSLKVLDYQESYKK